MSKKVYIVIGEDNDTTTNPQIMGVYSKYDNAVNRKKQIVNDYGAKKYNIEIEDFELNKRVGL